MRTPDGAAGGRRRPDHGVLVLAALLPLVELGRIVLREPLPGLVAAVVLTLVALPVLLRLVAGALRGQRATRAGWSLAVLAALMGLGLVLVETTWGFLLGSFAVSVLLVLRWPWSLPAFVAVLVLVSVESSALCTDGVPASARLYLVLVVSSRALCLYVIVRLVAHLRVLDEARAGVARSAVEQRRARTALDLTRSLSPAMERVGRRAASLPRSLDGEGADEAVAALADEARQVMADVRRVVATTRDRTSQRAMADAGRLLRGDPVGTAPDQARPTAPGLTASTLGALLLAALVRVIVLGILLFVVVGVGIDVRLPSWCVAVAVAVAALEAVVALRTALAPPPARVRPAGVAAAASTAVLVVTTLVVLPDPGPFLVGLAYVSSAAVLVLPGRWRWAAVAGVLLVLGAAGLEEVGAALTTAGRVWYLLVYLPTTHLFAVGALLASARLVVAVSGLETTRETPAESAVVAEDRRCARDLRDILVQRLSAVALTADLVQRLSVHDAAGAARELDGLRALAEGLAEEAWRVGQGERAVTLSEEVRTAAQLLGAAGTGTDIRVDTLPGSPAAESLLGRPRGGASEPVGDGASEPPGALGDPQGVDPVARPELRDRRGQVVPHRRR